MAWAPCVRARTSTTIIEVEEFDRPRGIGRPRRCSGKISGSGRRSSKTYIGAIEGSRIGGVRVDVNPDRSGARSSSDRSGMRPGTGDGLAACTGGGLAACTSSTCSRNCLVSSCRFSLMKSRGKCNDDGFRYRMPKTRSGA